MPEDELPIPYEPPEQLTLKWHNASKPTRLHKYIFLLHEPTNESVLLLTGEHTETG